MCDKCDGGISDLVVRYRDDQEKVFDLFIDHGLILESKTCEKCHHEAKCDFRRGLWRCRKTVSINKTKPKQCDWSKSIYKNTFFDKASVDKLTLLVFISIYLRNYFCYQFAIDETKWSQTTINDWCSFVREVLVVWCLDNTSASIGGPGVTVEIDESKFGKRKNYCGRVIEGQWVFGGVCRETGQIFLVPVPDRTKETLVKIIKEKIVPGTTIISDCWKAYNSLGDEGYEHQTVNHTYNFVDPQTKAHTQNIERVWRDIKSTCPRYGRRSYNYVGYLARSIFLRSIKDGNQRLHHFLLAAAKLYNPHQPPTVPLHHPVVKVTKKRRKASKN